MLVSTLLLFAGSASAVPVIFTWESSTSAGATFPSTQVFNPALPFSSVVNGDVDEAGGTYNLTLPAFDVVINIAAFGVPDDAQIFTTGWGQVGTFTPGAGELALMGTSASGEINCDPLSGSGGLVCNGPPVLPPPGDPGSPVLPWPPAAGDPNPPFGPSGAWINTANGVSGITGAFDGTITVNEPFSSAGGQLQNVYRYSFVPEPGTVALLGAGLFGLLLSGRRRA